MSEQNNTPAAETTTVTPATENTVTPEVTTPVAETTTVTPATENVTNPDETTPTDLKSPAYMSRVEKAFEGKDLRVLVHQVNPLFPDIRTSAVAGALHELKACRIANEALLKAVEEADGTHL